MNKKILTIQDIKTLVRPVAEKYRIKDICLFGSYARGEADESSDLYRNIMKEKITVV